MPLDLGLVVSEYLSQYPRARHFDVARIVIDQAVRLGVAQADSPDCQRNGSRLMITEPRYRRMSSTNIEQVMPVKLAQALANPLFPALDSALRSGRHIGLDELDNHAFLMDFRNIWKSFTRVITLSLFAAPEGFFYLRPRSTTLIPRSVLSELDMMVGKILCYLYPARNGWRMRGVFSPSRNCTTNCSPWPMKQNC